MTEAEWFARIVAAPTDLELRRVYADWLIEKGDPRGEFIALECRALAEPDHADVIKWKRRATTIRKANAEAWWGRDYETRGGMIEAVRASSRKDFDQLLAVAPALVRLDVQIGPQPPAADHPLWGRLRYVDAFSRATQLVIDALDARMLTRLESLRVVSPSDELARALVRALAYAPALTRLELVKLEDGTVLRGLAELDAKFHALDFYDTELDGDTAVAIGKCLVHVVELSLGSTSIGVAGLNVLARAKLGALECLDLRRAISKTTPAAPTLRLLADAAPNLRALELMGARITEDAIAALAAFTRLEELSLHGCDVEDISELPRTLRALNLRANKLVDVSPLEAMKRLELVNLENNPLSEASQRLLKTSKLLANVTVSAGKLPSQLFSEARNDKHGFWLGSTNYREKNVIRRPAVLDDRRET